jgi:hypothetical protein
MMLGSVLGAVFSSLGNSLKENKERSGAKPVLCFNEVPWANTYSIRSCRFVAPIYLIPTTGALPEQLAFEPNCVV